LQQAPHDPDHHKYSDPRCCCCNLHLGPDDQLLIRTWRSTAADGIAVLMIINMCHDPVLITRLLQGLGLAN
jgi:hypothetical protein